MTEHIIIVIIVLYKDIFYFLRAIDGRRSEKGEAMTTTVAESFLKCSYSLKIWSFSKNRHYFLWICWNFSE